MADSVDRARFRAAYCAHCMVEAVCRSWPAAANEHIPCLPRRRPWIVLTYPYFITSSDDNSSCRRLSYLPENTECIGSTDDWIALRRVVVDDVHSYLLHNHFSDTTLAQQLDTFIADASRLFDVRKVLVRSTNPWDSVDRARFRADYRAHTMVEAVCLSWRATAREHLPRPPRRLPWIVLTYGYFMTSSDNWCRRIPSLPKNVKCIGSTDDWNALQGVVIDNSCGNARETHSYLLHNPFSKITVPLPELDTLIGDNVSILLEVRKVLMRSNPRDVVAILTNNYNYPIILVRPGKGVWLPRLRSAPFIYIIDIVFIGDRLYGITQAEDLISLDIAFGVDGMPIITRAKRVIRHLPKAGDHSKVWSNVDFLRVRSYPSKLDDGYDLWSDVDEKYHKYVAKDKGEQGGETLNGEHDEDRVRYMMTKNTNDNTISEGIHYDKSDELLITTLQIVESLGKLLMVRRKLHCPPLGYYYTRSVDVFEANITAGEWVPVKDGLCGQALFISRYCCKSIHASGEIEKDAVYFADTGEVLDLRSRIISQPQRNLWFRWTMWLFPPEPDVDTI
uniref:KIB1-4 beta-propeller domain-containing protein n=1 Tax=Aegilops tauschii TaxID=37682 RepID=R7W2G7_AEGTA